MDDISAGLKDLADQHGAATGVFRNQALGLLKEKISTARSQAENALLADGNGLACAQYLSQLQDSVIMALYNFAINNVYRADNPSTSEHLCIVAVGGYGRGTLAPGSDIDLLFILPYKQTAWGESIVEYLLYFLWDLGLKVGHSTRSIDDCIRLSQQDGTIMTAILEARYICGHKPLYDELRQRFRNEIVAGHQQAFVAEKLAERELRHQRSGESRYLVEPNVKDGKGGQRDLQTLFWIAKFLYDMQTPQDLIKAKVFSPSEFRIFRISGDFLWTVRCHLHFITGRSEDRLSFEHQSELAQRLNYSDRGGLRPVERFMKHYFLVAKDVGDLTRVFCASLEAQQIKTAPSMSRFFGRLTQRIPAAIRKNPAFRLENGRLQLAKPDLFERDPVHLIRLFSLANDANVGIHPDTLKQLRRSLKLITKEVREDEQANALFLSILTTSKDPEAVLRIMNEAGVLGRFIPDFGRIVAMMQFSMYHHYTVDEHLLRTVGALAMIEQGILKDEHPLASDLIAQKKNRTVLYVAALLHDIAKGRKEHHSIAGERIARTLAPRLGLTASETDTVAWLIRHHLLMSETAQMRDINDFKTILDFAQMVQSPERLRLLLILTVIDIRAVGPGVWNGWKGQLLRNLYFETIHVVSGGHSSVTREQRAQEAQARFREHVTQWQDSKVSEYFAKHYPAYWSTVDLEHQLMHAELIEQAADRNRSVALSTASDAFTAITEITVYAPDHPRLLSLLTGVCAAAGANIASAQIFTTTDGMALDTLLIQREFDEERDELRRTERVTELIRAVLCGEKRLRDLPPPPRMGQARLDAFSVEPQVTIDNDSSNRFTVIEVAGRDRVGFLHELTEALFRLNLNIASAHITTFGERAVDVFYVTDLTGSKITNANRRAAISRHLLPVLAVTNKQAA